MMKSLRFFIMALLCAVANVAWSETKTVTLSNANIVAAGDASTSYQSYVITDENKKEWNAFAIKNKHSNATSDKHYLQIKKYASNSAYYIQVPVYGTKITSIQMTVSNSSQPMTGGGNSATLFFSNNNSTSATGTGVASGTGASSVTIDCSSLNLNTGYITASGAVRIWDVTVTYEEGSSNQVATPTFDPDPNDGPFSEAKTVTIKCDTEGATIFYTTDGQEPSTSGTGNASPVSVSVTKSGTTIKAIAVKQGLTNSTVASATYTIKPENPSITQEGNTITMSAATGCTIYYNTGTNYSNTNDPTNASTPYTGPIEMTESAYFKAIAYDEYGNPSGIKSLDFKYSNVIPHPKNINSNYYVKVTNASELEDGDAILFVSKKGDVNYAMGADRGNNRGAVEVTVSNDAITNPSATVQKIVLVKDDSYYYFNVGNDGYLYAASSSSNYLKTEQIPDENNNAKATIVFSENVPTITFQGNNTRNIIKFNQGNNPLIFSCYASGQTDIQIYKEVLAPFELVIHPKATDGKNNYYATISNLGEGNYVVPEGLEVSTITIVNRNINKTQTWAKDDVIPGDKAYYVMAAGIENPSAEDLTFTFVPSTNTEEISLQDNWLYPAIAGQEITAPDDENKYLFYKLTLDANDTDGSIGFYFGEDNGGTFSFSNDHKAYLAVPQNGDSNEGMSSIVVGDFTGISDIQPNKEQNNEVYTLSGVRVKGNLPKGIYIVNGKKQIVK